MSFNSAKWGHFSFKVLLDKYFYHFPVKKRTMYLVALCNGFSVKMHITINCSQSTTAYNTKHFTTPFFLL